MAVKGLREILKKIKVTSDAVDLAVASGLYVAAEDVMTGAKMKVPVDLGALKGSGYVTRPTIAGNVVSLEIGFGGPAADYAVVQHEDLSLNHPDGGEAKFLERSIQERSERVLDVVSKFAAKALMSNQAIALPPGSHPATPNGE